MANLSNVNELIDQNQIAAAALSTEADRAVECVSHIEELIAQLNSNLSSARGEAQERLEAFTSALDGAEQALEENLQTAREKLDSLLEKVSTLDSQVDEIAEGAKTQIDELKSYAETVLSDIETEVEAAQTGLSQLDQQIQDIQTEANNLGETAKSGIEEFRAGVDTAQGAFHDRKASLVEQFEALEAELKEQLEAVTTAFETLVENSTNNVTDLEGVLDTKSSEVMDSLTEKFTGEVQDQFSESIELLTTAMSTLSDAGESSQELLDGALGDVVGSIEDVLEVVAPVLDVLDTVQDLLG